ncbi:MAG: YkgJ family cysteine cluster protein [Myxococcaceae bacterium]
MNERTASELCQQCAICCDGTLFPRIPLSPTDARTLSANGFALARRSNGAVSLPLACQALEGTRCTRYDLRPGSCRAYRCDLLVEVEEGRSTFDEALRVIEEAKRLRRTAVNRELETFLEAHFHRGNVR